MWVCARVYCVCTCVSHTCMCALAVGRSKAWQGVREGAVLEETCPTYGSTIRKTGFLNGFGTVLLLY